MPEVGTIFTQEEALRFQRENNPYWSQLYSDVERNYGGLVTGLDINRQIQESSLLRNYSSNIANAYESALGQRTAIAASNLGQGYKEAMMADVDEVLNNAYDAYLQNYMSDKSTIGSGFQSEVQSVYEAAETQNEAINQAMELEAKYTADYLNAHFDYLTKLYEKDSELFASDEMSDYVNREISGGQYRVTLKDAEEIRNMMFDKDDDGYSLNERGRNFIKQIQSMQGYTFGDYLYDENKNLYDWAVSLSSSNMYSDLNGPTNRAAALGQIGLTDIDSGYEYTGGGYQENKQAYANERKTVRGDITTYTGGNNDVSVNTKITFKGNPEDEKGTLFRAKLGDKTYYLSMADEDPIKDGDIINDIDKAVGGITNHQLYYYEGQLYFSFVDDEGIRLRRVEGQGINRGNNTYEELLNKF